MPLEIESIRQRLSQSNTNAEFQELWNSAFNLAAPAKSLRLNAKLTERNKLLAAHDGTGGQPSGFTGLLLSRSFQPIPDSAGPAQPALEFTLKLHALLPVTVPEATHPWSGMTGWILYHRVAAAKVSEAELNQAAAGLWLLQHLKVPVFRVVSVYLDKDYRLATSQELSTDLFKTHSGASYNFHEKVCERLRQLESEIETCENAAQSDYPSATKDSAKTIKAYYQMRCLRDFMRPDAPTRTSEAESSCEANTPATVQDLINDKQKFWETQGLPASTELKNLDAALVNSLSTGHQLQVAAAQTNSVAWSAGGKDALTAWLEAASEAPHHYFDLETYSPSLPIWPGTRMNQPVPFQFSLHSNVTTNDAATHSEFINEEPTDPRHAFAAALMAAMPDEGHGRLFIYTNYEVQVLDELLASLRADGNQDGTFVDRFETWWTGWKERIVDLHQPFYLKQLNTGGFEAWLYHPNQHGSTSIKKVVPALTDKNPYGELAIQDGLTATDSYIDAIFGKDRSEPDETLEDLKAYCKVDTEVMVDLWDALTRL